MQLNEGNLHKNQIKDSANHKIKKVEKYLTQKYSIIGTCTYIEFFKIYKRFKELAESCIKCNKSIEPNEIRRFVIKYYSCFHPWTKLPILAFTSKRSEKQSADQINFKSDEILLQALIHIIHDFPHVTKSSVENLIIAVSGNDRFISNQI